MHAIGSVESFYLQDFHFSSVCLNIRLSFLISVSYNHYNSLTYVAPWKLCEMPWTFHFKDLFEWII